MARFQGVPGLALTNLKCIQTITVKCGGLSLLMMVGNKMLHPSSALDVRKLIPSILAVTTNKNSSCLNNPFQMTFRKLWSQG